MKKKLIEAVTKILESVTYTSKNEYPKVNGIFMIEFVHLCKESMQQIEWNPRNIDKIPREYAYNALHQVSIASQFTEDDWIKRGNSKETFDKVKRIDRILKEELVFTRVDVLVTLCIPSTVPRFSRVQMGRLPRDLIRMIQPFIS